MRRRHWADLACVSALALSLTATVASAEGPAIDPTLGIPLPEQPALLLLAEELPPAAQAPVSAEAAPVEPTRQTQTAVAPAAEPGMVTGAVTPSARPEGSLATPELPVAPVAVPDEPVTLDIPQIELPPADPALAAPQAAPVLRSAEPAIAPPDLPKVVVDLPAGTEFAAAIAARAADALALPRLSERERAEILAAYEANGNRPLWIEGRGWSAAGLRLTDRLGRAGEDGLRPTDYPLPVFEASDKGSLAEAPPLQAADADAVAALRHRGALGTGGRRRCRRCARRLQPVP